MSEDGDIEFGSPVVELSDWLEFNLKDGSFVSVRREAVIAVETADDRVRLTLLDGSRYETTASYEDVMERV